MWFARVDQLTVAVHVTSCTAEFNGTRHKGIGKVYCVRVPLSSLSSILLNKTRPTDREAAPNFSPKPLRRPLSVLTPAALKHRRIALRKQKETSGEVGRRSKSEVSRLVSQSALYTDGLGR